MGLQRLIAFLIPLLMFFAGFFQTLRELEVRIPFLNEPARELLNQPDPATLISIGILFMFLPWCLLLLKAQGASGKKLLELRTESGSTINVRKRAISAYVKDCLDSMSFVRDVRVSTTTQRGALALELRVWVAATDKMDSLQQKLIDTVTDDLQRGFGIARIIEPKIIIEAVKNAPRRKGSAARLPKREEKEASKSLLAPETAALSAPEVMSEKEVLEYAPVDETDSEKENPIENPSHSSAFGSLFEPEKAEDENIDDENKDDENTEGENEK